LISTGKSNYTNNRELSVEEKAALTQETISERSSMFRMMKGRQIEEIASSFFLMKLIE